MTSPFIPKSKVSEIAKVGLHFTINGSVKQSGTAKDMIFDVPHLISFVSGIMKLEVSAFSGSRLLCVVWDRRRSGDLSGISTTEKGMTCIITSGLLPESYIG